MAPRLSELTGPRPLRVLYSFPHKLGADRICHTAWQQVAGLAAAGEEVTVMPGAVQLAPPAGVRVAPTLAFGALRIPYRLIGVRRACALHDWVVARRLRAAPRDFDLVHAWPLGARHTLRTARALGVPVLLERPNAHTRFAYEVVERECAQIGLRLEPDHEHARKDDWLRIEEEEYAAADGLLCPSDFVVRTFLAAGHPTERLLRHHYGYDAARFFPPASGPNGRDCFTVLFAGGCAPRKGLHHALAAWRACGAGRSGRFLIAGEFVPGYADCIRELIDQPGISLLGHRRDLPALMRRSDVLVLPSVEEGSALVTSEARACGCVLAVSDASGAICTPGEDGLVHPAGDVRTLTEHLATLRNPEALARLRAASLRTTASFSWTAAGRTLARVYRDFLTRWPDPPAAVRT
jgi:glycosyltransferase involved in cell wall biosynthesis